MEILYKSTRGTGECVTASQAILKGLSDDGGLFVPTQIPVLDIPVEKLASMTYQEIAYEVMSRFLTDFTEDELKACIERAYDSKFDTKEIAPVKKADGAYYLELFHGATIAFKDMALSILPHLLTTSAKKNNVKNEIVILTATSGDTGKAAMAGFADVPGTKIIVFYPKNGVSPVQEKQMVHKKEIILTLLESQETLTMLRQALRKCLMIRIWQKSFQMQDISSHQRTLLILDVLFHRLCITYMLMQPYIKMEK